MDLFAPVTWSGGTATQDTGADYPGTRPVGSSRLSATGELHGLDAGGGWRDRETGEEIDVAGRRLVLAYGSNAHPEKLFSRAGFVGDDGVIALRTAVFGWAAAWCDARRRTDGSVVATLVPAPGRVEVHPVLALTPHQLSIMDDWEGHPDCYMRTPHEGPAWEESGRWLEDVHVYLGTPQHRPALLVAGRPVLCAETTLAIADALVL